MNAINISDLRKLGAGSLMDLSPIAVLREGEIVLVIGKPDVTLPIGDLHPGAQHRMIAMYDLFRQTSGTADPRIIDPDSLKLANKETVEV